MVNLEDAREVANFLAKTISPVSVVVFGSVATSGKGNDLDLLVVTNKENMHDEVGRCLRVFHERFAIDYVVASIDQVNEHFMQGSPFLRLVQSQGKVLYMKDSIKEWIALAREDLKQAKYLFDGGFYRGACFDAQQAVEKAIKAELIKRGWELEKIHNIRRLLYLLKEHNLSIKCDDDDIDFMDSIYRGRYPAEEGLLPLKIPVREDASRAISIAEDILKQLKLQK
ncbi:MAG: HEPN domain-containing protein [Deltaproteobacteria bacterium]|nr:HEPN domain-containing protein [Deltaproteobacteria bacterium]MBW1963150.1 HEPN domain-containing protein [Deltaproteobacteria bacterium]MBW2154304.1 HEPN domain-containing protein [Deltaproteobacteria bacterium]